MKLRPKLFACFCVFLAVIQPAPAQTSAPQKTELQPANKDGLKESGDKSKADKKTVMTIDLVVDRPQNARGYKRPYIAVWLQDKDGFPVRTIALWVQASQPGPRWIPDLRQWYRDDRMRKLVDDTNLVDGVSGATRTAGNYKIAWDGCDDQGKILPNGTYTLLVESAREHGTYQIAKQVLEIGDKPFKKEIAGNVEIKSINVDFVGMSKATK